jgi:hypothetical protein
VSTTVPPVEAPLGQREVEHHRGAEERPHDEIGVLAVALDRAVGVVDRREVGAVR